MGPVNFRHISIPLCNGKKKVSIKQNYFLKNICSKQLVIKIVTHIIKPNIADLIYYDWKIQKNNFFAAVVSFSFTVSC
jgi:hypothetical protein